MNFNIIDLLSIIIIIIYFLENVNIIVMINFIKNIYIFYFIKYIYQFKTKSETFIFSSINQNKTRELL